MMIYDGKIEKQEVHSHGGSGLCSLNLPKGGDGSLIHSV